MASHFDPNLPDVNRGVGQFAVTTLFTILITMSTGGRFVMKYMYKSRRGWDDIFIGISLVINLAANGLEFANLHEGFGRHVQYLTPEQRTKLLMYRTILVLMAGTVQYTIKLSICFFLLSILRGSHQRAVWAVYGLIVLTSIVSIGQCVAWGFQAHPLAKIWDPSLPGWELPLDKLMLLIKICSSVNAITDAFYALSPIYFFGTLKISRTKKAILIALTGAGMLVVAASIVRVVLLPEFLDPDFSYAVVPDFIADTIERNLAEVIADLPAIYPLMRGAGHSIGTMLSGYARALGTRSSSKRDPESGNGSDKGSGEFGVATIGSGGVSSTNNKNRYGSFAVYGKHGQFSVLEDEIPLKDKDAKVTPGIVIETSIASNTVDLDKQGKEQWGREAVWPFEEDKNQGKREAKPEP